MWTTDNYLPIVRFVCRRWKDWQGCSGTMCYDMALDGISFNTVLLWFYGVYFFYLAMKDHVIDACDYIMWCDVIGLEGFSTITAGDIAMGMSALWLEHSELIDDIYSSRVEQLVQGTDHDVLV